MTNLLLTSMTFQVFSDTYELYLFYTYLMIGFPVQINVI